MNFTPNSISVLADGFRPMWRNPDDWKKIAHGLRMAGLPD